MGANNVQKCPKVSQNVPMCPEPKEENHRMMLATFVRALFQPYMLLRYVRRVRHTPGANIILGLPNGREQCVLAGLAKSIATQYQMSPAQVARHANSLSQRMIDPVARTAPYARASARRPAQTPSHGTAATFMLRSILGRRRIQNNGVCLWAPPPSPPPPMIKFPNPVKRSLG